SNRNLTLLPHHAHLGSFPPRTSAPLRAARTASSRPHFGSSRPPLASASCGSNRAARRPPRAARYFLRRVGCHFNTGAQPTRRKKSMGGQRRPVELSVRAASNGAEVRDRSRGPG